MPEAYLARWPTDPKADPDAASLLVAEYFERRERGDRPSLSDYEERFPEHAPALADMIRDTVRSFTSDNIAPIADEIESAPVFQP